MSRFSFDPPPDFEPGDDPAALELEQLEHAICAERRSDLASVAAVPERDAWFAPPVEALRALSRLSPVLEAAAAHGFALLPSGAADTLEALGGGRWNGNTLEDRDGSIVGVLVGVPDDPAPHAFVLVRKP